MWILLATYVGFRRSEIEALDWDRDIELAADADAGRVLVPGKKTSTAYNFIPIPSALTKILRSVPVEERHGSVVEPWRNVGRDLPAACERVRIRRAIPNDLRRTFASWMMQAGENTLTVAKLLRHSSTKMLERVYGQLADRSLARAVESLPKLPEALEVRRTGVGNLGKPEERMRRRRPRKPLEKADFEVPRDGVEPPTRGFSVPCSTT